MTMYRGVKDMNQKILNITNGDSFNGYFLSKFGGEAVPFREVMMDGDSEEDIYSEEFVRLRSFAFIRAERQCGGIPIQYVGVRCLT